MKKTLTITLILALIAVGAFFVYTKCVPGEAYALKLKFHKGQVDNYRVHMGFLTQRISTGGSRMPSPLPKQNLSMMLIQSVERINPDGSADIKYTFRDVKLNATAGHWAEPGNASVSATIGSDGKVIKMGQSSHPMSSLLGPYVEMIISQISDCQLPEQPVHIGETWNGVMNLPDAGRLDVIYRLVANNELVGRSKAVRISGESSYDGTFADFVKRPAASKSAGVPGPGDKLSLQGNRTIYLSSSEGKVLRVESVLKVKCILASPKIKYDTTLDTRMDKID